MNRTLTATDLKQAGVGAFFRPVHLAELGVSQRDLSAMIGAGTVERVARGLYRLSEIQPTEQYTLAAVCARVPKAIVCLLSALTVHEIGTQLPREAWIGIPQRSRTPRIPEFPTRFVRYSGPSFTYGVEDIRFEGVPGRITNVARTVVDCFRFRRLVGLDVARESVREALAERKTTAEELWRAAEMCRARSLVGPYLEVLAG